MHVNTYKYITHCMHICLKVLRPRWLFCLKCSFLIISSCHSWINLKHKPPVVGQFCHEKNKKKNKENQLFLICVYFEVYLNCYILTFLDSNKITYKNFSFFFFLMLGDPSCCLFFFFFIRKIKGQKISKKNKKKTYSTHHKSLYFSKQFSLRYLSSDL